MRKPIFFASTLIVGTMLATMLVGCQVFQPSATPQGTVTATLPGTVSASTTPGESVTTTPGTTTPAPPASPQAGGSDQPIALNVWTLEPFTPTNDAPGGDVLLNQLAAFDDNNPDIQVEVHSKVVSGPGSTLAYLRSAPSVAPDVLPDLALLDRDTLIQAADEGLIVPVGPLLDPSLLDSIYPVAAGLGTVQDSLYGVPYILQTQHLAYRETLFQDPPNSFAAILESPVPYIFPAGTLGSINRTTLLQYLAAGGALADDSGAPYLDTSVLTDLLTFYASASEAGVIDTTLFQLNDPDESWAMYTGRQAGLVTVTSSRYLAERADVRSTGVTWVPTPDGQPMAVVSGWSWVLVTQDPDRQAAALALIDFLMNPINQGGYTQAAGWLPSQPDALAVWGNTDTYVTFADTLLTNGVVLPDPTLRSSVGVAIQDALEAVLLTGMTPVQAANEASQTINPSSSSGG